ncbi:MAG: hypothetical protein WCX65_18795 [bacterium]
MTKGKTWFYALLALVFAVGFFAGGFAGPRVMRPVLGCFGVCPVIGRHAGPGPERGPHMGAGIERGRHGEEGHFFTNKMKGRFVDKLGSDLSLTKEQKAQLGKIIDKNEPKFIALRKDMKKNFEGFRKNMDAQIEQILTAEQKAKFKKMHERPPRSERPGDEERP